MTKIQNNKKIPISYNPYLTTRSALRHCSLRGDSPDSVEINRTDSVKPVQAFTLLELLLVIAVIAILAGLVLFALNPAQRLDDAKSAQTMAKSDDIRKAIEAYAVDHGGSMPTNIASLTTYGLHDVCKAGQSTNCLNLDQLVTDGYLGSIPEDTDGSTTVISGYKLEYNPAKNNVQVYNTDSFAEYVEDGATLTRGLIGHWKMDENTGTSTADSTGNGNTGTLTNGPTWTGGRYDDGINFDGVNDSISFSRSSAIQSLSNEGTISMWVKYNTLDSSSRTGLDISGTGINGLALFTSNASNKVVLNYGNGTTSNGPTSTSTLVTGQWYHITAIWTQTNGYIYINGTLENSVARVPSIIVGSGTSYIGCGSGCSIRFHSGVIDDTRVYNRALNSQEISALYNYAPPAVAHWKFDDATGTIAVDSVGSTNGTLTNGPTWTTGKYQGGVNFDGINDFVSGSISALPSSSKPRSISGWIYMSSDTATTKVPFAYGTCSVQGDAFGVYLSSAETLNFWGCGSGDFSTGNTVSLNQWHHLVATYDGAFVQVFLNGTQVGATTAKTLNTGSTGFFAGSDGSIDPSNYSFSGSVDDVRVYNYALNQTQIQKIMNNNI